MQIPGEAFCVSRAALLRAMTRDENLRTLLLRYCQWLISQIAQTAACNRLHSLEQRYCRWLLIAHHNAGSDTFALTHEYFA